MLASQLTAIGLLTKLWIRSERSLQSVASVEGITRSDCWHSLATRQDHSSSSRTSERTDATLKMLEKATIRTTGLDAMGVDRKLLVSGDIKMEIVDLAGSGLKAQSRTVTWSRPHVNLCAKNWNCPGKPNDTQTSRSNSRAISSTKPKSRRLVALTGNNSALGECHQQTRITASDHAFSVGARQLFRTSQMGGRNATSQLCADVKALLALGYHHTA